MSGWLEIHLDLHLSSLKILVTLKILLEAWMEPGSVDNAVVWKCPLDSPEVAGEEEEAVAIVGLLEVAAVAVVVVVAAVVIAEADQGAEAGNAAGPGAPHLIGQCLEAEVDQ